MNEEHDEDSSSSDISLCVHVDPKERLQEFFALQYDRRASRSRFSKVNDNVKIDVNRFLAAAHAVRPDVVFKFTQIYENSKSVGFKCEATADTNQKYEATGVSKTKAKYSCCEKLLENIQSKELYLNIQHYERRKSIRETIKCKIKETNLGVILMSKFNFGLLTNSRYKLISKDQYVCEIALRWNVVSCVAATEAEARDGACKLVIKELYNVDVDQERQQIIEQQQKTARMNSNKIKKNRNQPAVNSSTTDVRQNNDPLVNTDSSIKTKTAKKKVIVERIKQLLEKRSKKLKVATNLLRRINPSLLKNGRFVENEEPGGKFVFEIYTKAKIIRGVGATEIKARKKASRLVIKKLYKVDIRQLKREIKERKMAERKAKRKKDKLIVKTFSELQQLLDTDAFSCLDSLQRIESFIRNQLIDLNDLTHSDATTLILLNTKLEALGGESFDIVRLNVLTILFDYLDKHELHPELIADYILLISDTIKENDSNIELMQDIIHRLHKLVNVIKINEFKEIIFNENLLPSLLKIVENSEISKEIQECGVDLLLKLSDNRKVASYLRRNRAKFK